MVLLSLVLGCFFELPRHFVSSARDALSAIFYVSNYAFNNSNYFARASESKPLLHTWSLSVEGQFYLWLAFGYFFAYKYCRKWIRLIVNFLIILSFLYASYVAQKNINGFYLITARVWELLVGVALINIKSRKKRPILLFLALSLILYATVSFNEKLIWPTYLTIIPVIAAAIIIYIGGLFQKNIFISNKLIQTTGNISYSLYLIHWPVWVFAFQYFDNQVSSLIKLSLIVVTFILAFISYYFVEKPFRNKDLIPTKIFYIFLLIAILVSTLLLLLIIKNKGYPKRFPSYVERVSINRYIVTPRNECFRRSTNSKKAKEQFCAFGKSNDPKNATAILWGDSHANQYLTPISNAANFLNLTGLIADMTGCVPSFNYSINDINDNSHCNDFNKEVSNYIFSNSNIKILILGMHWSESNVNNAILVVNRFINNGRKVILIGPLPKPGFDVEIYWSTKQIKEGNQIDEITIPNSDEVKQSNILQKLKKELMPSIVKGDLIIIDPSSEYCDQKSCYAVKDGNAIFKDDNHLTELSARRMESYFISALNRLK